MKHLAIILTLVSVLPTYLCAQGERRDGNWWVGQTSDAKLNYAVGFFDGMDLGYRFSFWGIDNFQTKKTVTTCISDVNKSYNAYTAKYFSNVTNEQLVDGLDNFYKDYRNRRIKASGAAWIVVKGIAGTPQSEMDKLIESWRKSPSTQKE